MLHLDTIRYMGNKSKLLSYIIPAIQEVTPAGGTVCDLMTGSNTVSYALKEFFTVYTNDVQEYCRIISDAVITNQTEIISSHSVLEEIKPLFDQNHRKHEFDFFNQTYSGTYFSASQCRDIDSIRYAIESITNPHRKALYLFALMGAMCLVQSTPGHFAQYMPSTHKRIIPLQQMDLWEEFLKKCDLYSNIYFSSYENKSFCMDYKDLFRTGELDTVDTIYLDSPYSQEQYSRFYHILETVAKYDSPVVKHKAGYREDRFMSDFCYKSKVQNEFATIFSFCKSKGINLVISYSNKAVLPINDLEDLCKEYFCELTILEVAHKHSTQGKGSQKIAEIIITCHN